MRSDNLITSDNSTPPQIEPSPFSKAFSIAGAFVAVTAVAMIVTYVLVETNRWDSYKYSIFGLSWGVAARWFESSVRRGIRHNLSSGRMSEARRKALGEQLVMLRYSRRFVHAELIVSGVLLLVEFLKRWSRHGF